MPEMADVFRRYGEDIVGSMAARCRPRNAAS